MCLFCSGNHCANDASCPEQQRQRNIKMVMSQENLSYIESSARFPQVKKTFAESANTFPSASFYDTPPSPQSQPHSPAHPSSQSYRKTILVRRKSNPSTAYSGYDRSAHNNIVREPISSQPNGCALNEENSSPNDNLIELLLNTLINILTRFSDSGLPNNMHQKLTQLLSLVSSQNGPIPPTVELP